MRTGAADPRWVILVKPGTYREQVYVQRERGNITVVGEDAAKTTITFDLNANLPGPDGKPIGTFRTPTVQIDSDGMIWENLTFANSAGPVGQALALRVDGDRVVFNHCRFLGWQDTLLVNRGRHYFADCYIEGHVDFIFGAATAFFERCHIHCLKDGYITAASTPEGQAHGLVFADCRITGAAGVRTYLGRPWRDFAQTVFLRTEMSSVVRPEGWHNWNKPSAEKTSYYAEFANFGPGASLQGRAAWVKRLESGAAARFTPAIVLAGTDGWNPAREPTLHLAGDSTMADKPDLEYPERGWGQLLRERIAPSWQLVNHAVNGRSTKSFRELGHWQSLLAQLQPGDWVVIQFGHNDEKKDDAARYTDPATEFPANLRRYVAEVRERGAHPVLATPVVRRNWSDAGGLLDSHGAYLTAVRTVAREEKVPLLEMEGATRALLGRLGPEASKKLFTIFAPDTHPRLPEGKTDNTHFTEDGARTVAGLAVDEFQRLALPVAVAFAAPQKTRQADGTPQTGPN
jgi:pectinesterase